MTRKVVLLTLGLMMAFGWTVFAATSVYSPEYLAQWADGATKSYGVSNGSAPGQVAIQNANEGGVRPPYTSPNFRWPNPKPGSLWLPNTDPQPTWVSNFNGEPNMNWPTPSGNGERTQEHIAIYMNPSGLIDEFVKNADGRTVKRPGDPGGHWHVEKGFFLKIGFWKDPKPPYGIYEVYMDKDGNTYLGTGQVFHQSGPPIIDTKDLTPAQSPPKPQVPINVFFPELLKPKTKVISILTATDDDKNLRDRIEQANPGVRAAREQWDEYNKAKGALDEKKADVNKTVEARNKETFSSWAESVRQKLDSVGLSQIWTDGTLSYVPQYTEKAVKAPNGSLYLKVQELNKLAAKMGLNISVSVPKLQDLAQ